LNFGSYFPSSVKESSKNGNYTLIKKIYIKIIYKFVQKKIKIIYLTYKIKNNVKKFALLKYCKY